MEEEERMILIGGLVLKVRSVSVGHSSPLPILHQQQTFPSYFVFFVLSDYVSHCVMAALFAARHSELLHIEYRRVRIFSCRCPP